MFSILSLQVKSPAEISSEDKTPQDIEEICGSDFGFVKNVFEVCRPL